MLNTLTMLALLLTDAQQSITVGTLPPVTITRDCFDKWTLIFSGLLAVVGLLGIFLAWRTVTATRDAAKAALKQTELYVNAERARVGIDISNMGHSFKIDGKNSGRTSARITYSHGFTVVLDTGDALPHVPAYLSDADDNSEWIDPTEKFDIFTGPDRYGMVADLSDPALCECIRDGKAILWAFGCIRYFDGISPDKREKRFCFATSVDESLETYIYSAGPAEYQSET